MYSADDARERRRAPRVKLFQPVEMRGPRGASRVHLLNVSTSGALAYAQDAPAAGETVEIVCGSGTHAARVAWSDGRRFGLAFAVPVAQARIDDLLRVQEELVARAAQIHAVAGEGAALGA